LLVADTIYIGKVFPDTRLAESERMDTAAVAEFLVQKGKTAQAFFNKESLLQALKEQTLENTCILFMSTGSFEQIPSDFLTFVHDSTRV
jgi:UDP-N-acetylmuramate-alanine ligase